MHVQYGYSRWKPHACTRVCSLISISRALLFNRFSLARTTTMMSDEDSPLTSILPHMHKIKLIFSEFSLFCLGSLDAYYILLLCVGDCSIFLKTERLIESTFWVIALYQYIVIIWGVHIVKFGCICRCLSMTVTYLKESDYFAHT